MHEARIPEKEILTFTFPSGKFQGLGRILLVQACPILINDDFSAIVTPGSGSISTASDLPGLKTAK